MCHWCALWVMFNSIPSLWLACVGIRMLLVSLPKVMKWNCNNKSIRNKINHLDWSWVGWVCVIYAQNSMPPFHFHTEWKMCEQDSTERTVQLTEAFNLFKFCSSEEMVSQYFINISFLSPRLSSNIILAMKLMPDASVCALFSPACWALYAVALS